MSLLHIIRAAVNPTAAPDQVGVHWVNTVTKQTFFSVGTGVVGDWKELGAAGGGGGGVDPSYVNATLTDTALVSTGAQITSDVNGGSLTISPLGTEKWELIFEGTVRLRSADGAFFGGRVYITDNLNNTVDGAEAVIFKVEFSASIQTLHQVRMTARVTLSAAQLYKLRMTLYGNNSAEMSVGSPMYAGLSTNNKFYAKRVY